MDSDAKPIELAKTFSEAQIARMNTDKSYAHEVANELKLVLARGNLDPQTKSAIEAKLKLAQQIAEAKSLAQNNIEKTLEAVTPQAYHSQTKEPSEKEKLAQKTKLLIDSRKSLLETVKGFLSSKKIVVVNDQGVQEEVVIDPDAGLPKEINGFAGEDPEALNEVEKKMKSFYENIPTESGAKVEHYKTPKGSFFAIIFPEGHNKIDLLAASSAEITNALLEKPKAAIKSKIEMQSESEQSARSRIGRTFSIVNGNIQELNDFHQAQLEKIIDKLWKSTTGIKKTPTATASRLDGGKQLEVGIS